MLLYVIFIGYECYPIHLKCLCPVWSTNTLLTPHIRIHPVLFHLSVFPVTFCICLFIWNTWEFNNSLDPPFISMSCPGSHEVYLRSYRAPPLKHDKRNWMQHQKPINCQLWLEGKWGAIALAYKWISHLGTHGVPSWRDGGWGDKE